MSGLHLTRDELRVLRALEDIENSNIDTGMIPTPLLAEELDADPDEVGIILRRLGQTNLVEGVGSIGVAGYLVARLTPSGRQEVRSRKTMNQLKAKLPALSGTVLAAVASAIAQAYLAPASDIHATVVVVSAGTGAGLGVLGGSKLQELLA